VHTNNKGLFYRLDRLGEFVLKSKLFLIISYEMNLEFISLAWIWNWSKAD